MSPAPFRLRLARGALLAALLACGAAHATEPGAPEACPRPAPGSPLPEPPALHSEHGVLRVDLTLRSARAADGTLRYCYLTPDGAQSPTLRLRPGDTLALRLHNGLAGRAPAQAQSAEQVCASGAMGEAVTNLHFHGLTVPPRCHEDEVLKTALAPGGVFEYRLRIPQDEPPGLYWYHPHIHGFSMQPLLGGASGALIVEGLERAIPELAGLPERVLVVRDQNLVHPQAPPARSEPVVAQILLDADGDAVNTHTGYGKPAKDLSVNFVPVPYPDYPPAQLPIRPGERQLWRVLNASALTYLHLALLYQASAQPLGLVALDGVPVNVSGPAAPHIAWSDHLGIPPGGRAEFIVTGPPAGGTALLMTRSVDTGASGDNDPNRALLTLTAAADAPAPAAVLPADPAPAAAPLRPWLGGVAPVRVRKLYFSEVQADPGNPASPVRYFITEQGHAPRPFDPEAAPDIVVHQGDVEDWIIENRTTELHAFHIHQVHFLLLEWFGLAVNEPFLRDTVNVPFYEPKMGSFPSVRLRMDFRDPDAVGTFVYHCHLLEHEDGGMMGTIRVDPAPARAQPAPEPAGPRPTRP